MNLNVRYVSRQRCRSASQGITTSAVSHSMRLIVEFRLAETSLSHLYGGDGYSSGSLRSKFTAAWRNRWHDLSVWQKVGSPEDVEPTRSVQAVGLVPLCSSRSSNRQSENGDSPISCVKKGPLQ